MLQKFVAVCAIGVALVGGSAASYEAFASPGAGVPTGGCPYPPNRPVLTIHATPSTVSDGQSTRIHGRFSQNNCGIHNGKIHLQHRNFINGKPSGSWKTWKTAITGTKGHYSGKRTPTRTEQERAVFNRAGKFPTTRSKTIKVTVKGG